MMAAEMKACPYCAEQVQAAAIKCRHCGSDLRAQTAATGDTGAKLKKPVTPSNVLAGLGTLLVLGYFVLSSSRKDQAPETTPSLPETDQAPAVAPGQVAPSSSPELAVPGQAETAIPEPSFVSERREWCTRYEAAANDIKKSEVFTAYYKSRKGKKDGFENVEATVKEIETPSGGSKVWLKVETPLGVMTNNDALQDDFLGSKIYEIKKGSSIYKALGELSPGSSIKVSGTHIKPQQNPFSEKDSVCDTNWIVRFTKIDPK